jgi:hypothetical protein
MDKSQIEERCQRVARRERCKHNMVFEYCAHCQKVESLREFKFPLEGVNEETGEEYTAWIRGVTTDVDYRTYRKRSGITHDHTPKLKGRWRTTDSAIKRVRF